MEIRDNKPVAIAIDGPSGAGKSTIARILASELGCLYVDTGALYRTVGYAALCRGIDVKSVTEVEPMLREITVELRHQNGVQRVWLNGEDVSDRIRTPEVSMAASAVSALPPVRQFLFHLQQDTARRQSVIMDGRDIGTVVLPFADVKIFLTASAEDRAQRRYLELQEKGVDTSYDEVLRDMKERDHNDATRAAAPLKAADDAILVDTSGNTLEQSVALLKEIILNALGV
ncbi:MAG: (d)CMP kinase [Clostridia bacterium]|nr:(d)CMP kinase [Clostridia bacterium]